MTIRFNIKQSMHFFSRYFLLKSFNQFSKFISCLLLLNIVFIPNTFAADTTVKALQMPAWLERDGKLSPLKPGIMLQSGDKVSTGNNARLLLEMDEGSLVKLGENAELNFDKLISAEEVQGFFEAALRLVKGAFRFTTTTLGKARKREVSVRIGSITAGIRGTDIWGSSKLDTDILCLIEGKITAQRAGEPEFEMNDPLSFYVVPKNKPAFPVSPVPEAKLAKWASETELLNGAGVLSIDGKWAVNLMSVTIEASVKPIMTALNAAGFAAEIENAIVNNKTWYRLRVSGFKSRDDASAFASMIKGRNGITQIWVVKL